jgi:uncharacterized protein with HEPN domain
VPPRQWKHRLKDMQEAVEKNLQYCESLSSETDLASDHKTLDACIRNFQVLGDAANQVPAPIREELKEISWREIRGMRNVLVHENFGVSPSILWNTVKKNLPALQQDLKKIIDRLERPSHPWRICPPGETYVRAAKINSYKTKGFPVKDHLRRDHCREIKGSSKDTLTLGEAQDIAEIFFSELQGPPSAQNLGTRRNEAQFDPLIRGWTKYWNDIFNPQPALDPDVVKALIASESGFRVDLGKGQQKVAKGLMQLMPLTLKALRGYRNELKDHLFEMEDADIYDNSLHISAGIRWLFQKRITASRRLKRQATWDEAVEDYKDFLRRRPQKNISSPHPKMDEYFEFLKKLKNEGIGK